MLKFNNIKKTGNCMIVAHYDDEIIFGFDELYENSDYTIVVCTYKDYEYHKNFLKVIKELGIESFAVFDNKDALPDENNSFDACFSKELEDIIHAGDYKKIVTHNSEGEYGHAQHKEVHNIVTNIIKDTYTIKPCLYVFDYNNTYISGTLIKFLQNDKSKMKIRLLKLYGNSLYKNKFILDLVMGSKGINRYFLLF